MDEQSIIGQVIGNYRITAEINSGAYGSVYKAKHTHLSGRIVAIKLLHAYMGSVRERDQFTQEAQFLALLEHPHILPVLDFGFHQGQPYLIAGYAAGGSLRDLLNRQTPLPLEQALSILAQVGQALSYAHQCNIIHRDLKPENILLNAQGNALVADFGIATMLSTASVKHLTTVGGTPPYMAPEQFQGTISKEGDQYALGCIAYELVTGHLPFTAPDFISMGWKHVNEQPVVPTRHNPQVPVATEAAILKALAKQRSERHADILSFVAALRVPFTQPTILSVIPISSPIQPTVLASASLAPVAPSPTSPALTKEQYLLSGNGHYDAGRYKEALDAYEQAIRLDPTDAVAYTNKGWTLNELGRYKEALIISEQAIRLDPHLADAYSNKGYVLDELKRYEEALDAYEQAIRLDPYLTAAYINKGNALNELERYEEALMACRQAIRLDPTDAVAYTNEGTALNGLGRYEEALVACEKAIRLDPTDVFAYYGKGNALKGLRQLREAQRAYEKARQLENNC